MFGALHESGCGPTQTRRSRWECPLLKIADTARLVVWGTELVSLALRQLSSARRANVIARNRVNDAGVD